MTAALEGDEWSAALPGRTLPLGNTQYPFYMRLVGPQGRSGRDSIPDRPARSQSLYRLSYPAHILFNLLMPNVNYSGRTAPLTSKVAFYIFIQQI